VRRLRRLDGRHDTVDDSICHRTRINRYANHNRCTGDDGRPIYE